MFRRDFVTLFIATFAALIGLGVIVPLLPLFAQDLGAGGRWLALTFAAFSISRTFTLAPIGRWSDRTSRKPFIVAGLCLSGGVGLLLMAADSLPFLVTLRFVQGITSALVLPIAMAYVGDITPPAKEGLYTGAFNMALFAGFGIGPLLGGFVKDTWNLDAAFLVAAALNLAAGLLVAIVLPTSPPEGEEASAWPASLPYGLFWKTPTLRGFLLFRLLAALGHGSLFSFLPILGRGVLGISSTQIGTVLTAQLMLGTVLQIPFGHLADRANRRMLMAIGIAVHTVSLVLIARSGSFAQLFSASLILGLADALLMPTMSAITIELGREAGMGSSQGMFSMAQSVGMIGSSFLGGELLNRAGASVIWYAAGALGILALAVLLTYSRFPMPLHERESLQRAKAAAAGGA